MKRIMISVLSLAALVAVTLAPVMAVTDKGCCNGQSCCGHACCHNHQK
jgi:hypothetical protein